MNRTLSFLVALTLSACLLASCGKQQPTGPLPSVATFTSADVSWPPPASASTPVAVDLLADNWVVVMDASGSMNNSSCGTGGNARMETAKAGAIMFGQSLPSRANLGLVVFSDADRGGITEWVKLGSGPENRSEFTRLVNGIRAYGDTPLSTAVELGADILTEQAQRQRGYGTYHLVIVTDGEANPGYDPTSYTKRLVSKTPIVVHAIGFCVEGGHSLNIKGYTHYASASDPKTLDQGLRSILAESETYTDSRFASP